MTETVDTEASLPAEDETEDHERAPAEEQEQASSLTALVEQFSREAAAFGRASLQLETARNMPEVRRVVREVAGVVVAIVAVVVALAFVNVAAMEGLSKAMASWLAALVLAAVWIVIACVLLFGYMERARRWIVWIAFKAPPQAALDELERERDEARAAMLATAERIGPAIAIEIATAAIPDAGEVAGEVAGGVIEVGDDVLEASDEIVEAIAAEIPGGGVVAQAWDVVLMPGRFGVRVATTVIRRVTRPPAG
jgi:hypothetical protein